MPGSSGNPRKPQFLTSEQLERIYFDTVSLKRRLLRQLLPEASAQLPFILSKLDSQGALFRSFQNAAAETIRTGAPVWVAASVKFSTPQFIQEDWIEPVNRSRSILFLSGPVLQGNYDHSDQYFRNYQGSSLLPVEMRASLFWIPEVWGYSACYADKPVGFERGEPREFWVFGSISSRAKHFHVKPCVVSPSDT